MRRLDPHVDRVDEAIRQVHAALHLGEHVGRRLPGDLHFVDLLDAVARVGELIGQRAVVGDEDQALARHVEPADVEHPPDARRQQVDHARPTARVASRRDDARRLVDGEVLQPNPRQRFAVDFDLLLGAIDPGAEFGDDLAVDLDATLGDVLFAFAAARQAGGGEHLLQPLAAAGSIGCRWLGANGNRPRASLRRSAAAGGRLDAAGLPPAGLRRWLPPVGLPGRGPPVFDLPARGLPEPRFPGGGAMGPASANCKDASETPSRMIAGVRPRPQGQRAASTESTAARRGRSASPAWSASRPAPAACRRGAVGVVGTNGGAEPGAVNAAAARRPSAGRPRRLWAGPAGSPRRAAWTIE